ncbi:sugar-phosphatase [Clostridium saccharobutylicum]|uniref:Sugar phosphatase YidA n=1 Tax=Clostridium saccharobutylicum TaxID=169679 RepID=A0A1S8MT84_CLOSA|nr:sugar-phosphatase [Clostridium saccharobutylicum]OOM07393.1 sugar phosphatase YidA [Clostridium saccharobutylicum]
MYKLIALDMDGTLLTTDKKVSEKTKAALKAAEEKGVKVVLASGRPLDGLTRYLEELDLFKGQDYVLSFNGGLVQNTKTKEAVSKCSLNGSDLKYAYEIAKMLNVNIHAFSAKEGLITPKTSKYTEYEADMNGINLTIKDFNEIPDDEDIIKVMFIDPQEILDVAIEKLPKEIYDKYSVFKSSPFFLEITNKNVDKGLGLKRLAEHLGIKQEEIIACGDAGNDLSMVKYAGLGVAMENATEDVKKVAQFITTSNDDDGIANVIEKFILS